MSRSPRRLGKLELDILRYVADHHPTGARDVAEHIASTTGQARTTVVTVLERLRGKGYVRRRRAAGIYQYAPRVEKGALLAELVQEFVGRVLAGSVSPLFGYLAQSDGLTDAEFAELKQLVAQLEHERAQEARSCRRGAKQ